MKRSILTLVTTMVISLAYVDVSRGMFDAFLFVQGLKGESTNAGRVDWTNIRAVSWAHGLPSVLGVTTTTTAKVFFQPLSVVKSTDSLSPALAIAAATGQPFATAVVELARSGQTNPIFLRVEFFDVRIVGYSAGGSAQGADGVPTEELKISYSRIRWTAFRISPTGQQIQPPFMGGWDVVNNKGF